MPSKQHPHGPCRPNHGQRAAGAPNHRGENHGQASIQATPDAVNLDERLLSISSHIQGQEKQTADNGQVTRQESLFDPWVEECPLQGTSPNAPKKRDVLGTAILSVLSSVMAHKAIAPGRGRKTVHRTARCPR
jgi:hypothetical protein